MRRFSPASGSALFSEVAVRVAFEREKPAIVDLAPQQHVIGHRGAIDGKAPIAIAVSGIGAAIGVPPDDDLAGIFVDEAPAFSRKMTS